MPENPEKFAATHWTIEDVQSRLLDDESWHPFQMTDEEVRQFYIYHERSIIDAMVSAGNEAIDTLLALHIQDNCHVWLVKATRQHKKDKTKEHLLYVMVTMQNGVHRWSDDETSPTRGYLTPIALEVLPCAANCAPGSRGWGDWGAPTIAWCVEIDRDPKAVKNWLSYEWEPDAVLHDLTPEEVGKQLDLLAAAKNGGKPVE